MGDINNTHGGGAAAAGATFPVAMYVLFLSYLALLLVPCSDLMHVLSLMCVVKYACASVMLLSVINLTRKFHNNPTSRKPYMLRQFSPSGFAAALKPSPFTGSHFKRWQNKTLLWLTAMGVHRVAEGIPRGPLTPEEDKAFGDATVIFVGAVLSVLGDKLVDAYLHIRNGKELWDALDAKFGAADAGGELYAMEQFNDYRMVENRSVVEQAHEIQIMAKELELLKCVLPDKFVAGCIVAKLPPSWRNFATSLKHQRHEFSVENIMGSLDVEEKARAKDKHTGGTEGRSAANMVQKNAHKSKGKNKGVSQTTNFKKKGKTEKKDPCWVCGETGHWANRCPQRKGKKCQAGQNSNSVSMVIGNTEEGTTGYGNILPTVLSVFQPTEWWVDTGANVHVCADISMFTSYQARGSSVMMGNGLHATVRGVGTVDLKFTSGKIVQLKNVLHVPSIKKNLVSGSRLMKDGFKLVFESNKVVLSKYGTFVGKGYECEGMLRFSLEDFCDNVVNHVSTSVNETNVWHSRLCHVNFGCMTRLADMSLIPKFTFVKGSKCHACVQAKQPRKPHKPAKERNLAPLELIHSDLCEMNGELTRGGKKYFMTLIDDSTRYCYVYLLKTKDEALDFFKIYKAEVENQLERKIKRVRSDRGGEYFSNEFNLFCAEHGIIHERTPPNSPQSNGIAERKNRTLTDLVNAMLDVSGLSKEWWGGYIDFVSCPKPCSNQE